MHLDRPHSGQPPEPSKSAIQTHLVGLDLVAIVVPMHHRWNLVVEKSVDLLATPRAFELEKGKVYSRGKLSITTVLPVSGVSSSRLSSQPPLRVYVRTRNWNSDVVSLMSVALFCKYCALPDADLHGYCCLILAVIILSHSSVGSPDVRRRGPNGQLTRNGRWWLQLVI